MYRTICLVALSLLLLAGCSPSASRPARETKRPRVLAPVACEDSLQQWVYRNSIIWTMLSAEVPAARLKEAPSPAPQEMPQPGEQSPPGLKVSMRPLRT
jgi:hypothetical protein